MIDEVRASNAAIKLAEDAKINLTDVEHNGEKVTKSDVVKHLKGLEESDESVVEVPNPQAPRKKALKCKFCGKSGPLRNDNRGQARCTFCWERFPSEE